MQIWGILGSLALGIFIGYLTWFFVVRLGSYNVNVLAALLAVILGGVVIEFLKFLKVEGAGFSQYAVGLLLGFLIYGLAHGGLPYMRPV